MQLLFFALIGLAAYMTYRKFVADAKKLAERRKMEERERDTGARGTLIQDPETGEYRVRRDDE